MSVAIKYDYGWRSGKFFYLNDKNITLPSLHPYYDEQDEENDDIPLNEFSIFILPEIEN